MNSTKNFSNIYQYSGVIHIHTEQSDGTGNVYSIAKAAKEAGLDWIIITDHNYYDNEEGIVDGVYVIKGQEISPKESDHYLAFGVDEIIQPTEPKEYVDLVRKKGGFGFAAHPDEGMGVNKKGESYPRKNSYHCIPWTDKSIKPDGIEIWNWFSNWADNLNDRNLLHLAYSYFFKHKTVTSPSKLTLDWWDKLNNERESVVPAIGGTDAHALKIRKYVVPVTIFPYKTCFETITNVINLKEPLSDDFKIAKEQILNAVKSGNNIIINRKVLNSIPQINLISDKEFANCGEFINLSENSSFEIKTEKIVDIRLIHNGNELFTKKDKEFKIPITQKGKYRIEFLYKGKFFAFTNPIVVK